MNLLAGVNKSADWLGHLAATLDLPPARYEAAERSYRSVSAWLERPQSQFVDVNVAVYTQGSFRLGTAIEPLQKNADYDLDIVCEFSWSKRYHTQADLHMALGQELKAYADRYNMQPPTPWDRCWTMSYADGARFHMDVLPCVPDGARQRQLREVASLSLAYVEKAVSITDKTHHHFRLLSDDWPASNPNGYAEWFYEEMKPVFDARRNYMMLVEAKADVADIPAFRVRTPLQLAIQILKRHRDMRFAEDESDHRPTSVVITTLAAHAYRQESTVAEALASILADMDRFVIRTNGQYWIANPADPRENFADAWNAVPAKADAFHEWLEMARTDFDLAMRSRSTVEFIDALAPRLGRELVEAAMPSIGSTALARIRSPISSLQRLRDAPHRRPVKWPLTRTGKVEIASAEMLRDGFRPHPLVSDAAPVIRRSKLTFEAVTDIPAPFEVYWQIINTGEAACMANNLRGRFELSRSERGHLIRRETAAYPGTHSIECFIIQNGYCVARSGIFIVHVS